jgi:hypothetical protein
MIKRMTVGTFILFAVLLFMLPRTDDDSKKKMASAAMLMCSTDFRKTVADQMLRGDLIELRFTNSCPDLIAALNVDEEGVIRLQGAKHGISMELTPSVEAGAVRWRCQGKPAQAITKLCKP